MILVFDLDDTLYDESTYVHSGFRAVAAFAWREWRVPRMPLFDAMLGYLEREGRGRVFDAALADFGIRGRAAARRCLAVYRQHDPDIRLSAAGTRCLRRFAGHAKYLVTDGNARVQERKIAALGIRDEFRRVFVTHRHGREHAKPSPYCFLRIAALEDAARREIVYVADNPHKDFVGIRPLGFRTVRVRTGPFRAMRARSGHDAEISIAGLDELTGALLDRLSRFPSRTRKRET